MISATNSAETRERLGLAEQRPGRRARRQSARVSRTTSATRPHQHQEAQQPPIMPGAQLPAAAEDVQSGRRPPTVATGRIIWNRTDTASATRTKIRIARPMLGSGVPPASMVSQLGRAGDRGQDDRQDEDQRDREQQDRRERRKQALEAVGDRLARRWSPDPARGASRRSGRPARRARRSWSAPASTMAAPRPTDWAAGRQLRR